MVLFWVLRVSTLCKLPVVACVIRDIITYVFPTVIFTHFTIITFQLTFWARYRYYRSFWKCVPIVYFKHALFSVHNIYVLIFITNSVILKFHYSNLFHLYKLTFVQLTTFPIFTCLTNICRKYFAPFFRHSYDCLLYSYIRFYVPRSLSSNFIFLHASKYGSCLPSFSRKSTSLFSDPFLSPSFSTAPPSNSDSMATKM